MTKQIFIFQDHSTARNFGASLFRESSLTASIDGPVASILCRNGLERERIDSIAKLYL